MTGTMTAPVTRPQMVEQLKRLRLWDAFRGQADEVADFLVALAAQFVNGALDALQTVELNPVIVTASGPRIADVLIVKPGDAT